MLTIRETADYSRWADGLKDRRAVARIEAQILRRAAGFTGNSKAVGEGVSELKVDYGPGYRVYYVQRGDIMLVLLCGGTKKGQQADIQQAKKLAAQLKQE